jgi:ribosomal protein S18 acetylase RimI-like enzyme
VTGLLVPLHTATLSDAAIGVSSRDHLPTLTIADPTSELGHQALRSYWQEIVSRYWGRLATAAEIDEVERDNPSNDLAPPAGLLVLALAEAEVVGCGGVRLCADGIAELTRIHVDAGWRKRGVGASIVQRLERHAIDRGRTRVRLDVRSDLIEARNMYVRLGYQEVPAFNEHPYVQHWFEKRLAAS